MDWVTGSKVRGEAVGEDSLLAVADGDDDADGDAPVQPLTASTNAADNSVTGGRWVAPPRSTTHAAYTGAVSPPAR